VAARYFGFSARGVVNSGYVLTAVPLSSIYARSIEEWLMPITNQVRFNFFTALPLVSMLLASLLLVQAQTPQELAELKAKVAELFASQQIDKALPLLEQLVKAEPNDPEFRVKLGFALIARTAVVAGVAEKKALNIRARESFIRARDLGSKEPVLDALIASVPTDGSNGGSFSKQLEAEKFMRDAETFFAQGKLPEALGLYQKALALDPQLYEAALFSGDVYVAQEDFTQAEVWYLKAIAIDPRRETAYRYSATPLMKQKKYDLARDRYVEAYITEPYSKFAIAGISLWGQTLQISLSHPNIDIPVDVTYGDKGDVKINLKSSALTGAKDDGSYAWLLYGTTRTTWHKEAFAKTYPAEKKYRHSLAEEADAIRSVLAVIRKDTKVQNPNTSLTMLKQLDEDGLLEAFILLARPDEGIAQDHAAYLDQNREKLRRYVLKYVIGSPGNK
jgi:tetratricopeptide (TPR) repeat protein